MPITRIAVLLALAPLAGCQVVQSELFGPPLASQAPDNQMQPRQGSYFSKSPGLQMVRNELFGSDADSQRPVNQFQAANRYQAPPAAASQSRRSRADADRLTGDTDRSTTDRPSRDGENQRERLAQHDRVASAPASHPAAKAPQRRPTRAETTAVYADPDDAVADHKPGAVRRYEEPEQPAPEDHLTSAESQPRASAPAALPQDEPLRAIEDYDVDPPPAPPAWLAAEATPHPRVPHHAFAAAPEQNTTRFVESPRSRARTETPPNDRAEDLRALGDQRGVRGRFLPREPVAEVDPESHRAASLEHSHESPLRSGSSAGRSQLASWDPAPARPGGRPYAARLKPWQKHVRERQAAFQPRDEGGFNPLREGDELLTPADDSPPNNSSSYWRTSNNWKPTTPAISMDGPNWEPNPLRTR